MDVFLVESFQDFLIELDMKPRMHLVEINFFSQNNVTVRLTKIISNLLEHFDFQSHFSLLTIGPIFPDNSASERN